MQNTTVKKVFRQPRTQIPSVTGYDKLCKMFELLVKHGERGAEKNRVSMIEYRDVSHITEDPLGSKLETWKMGF